MTEDQSSASGEGRGASVTMLAAREARSRRAATVCRPRLWRWTRSTDAGWPRRQSDRLRPHPGEASRGCPTHGRESLPGHRTPSCRKRQARAEPLARSANAVRSPAPRHSRERARGGTRAIGRAANRFPRAPEKLIGHNPAQSRTFAHNSALFRTQPRDAGRPARGRWPCGCGGGVRGGHRRRGRKEKTAARQGGRAMAARVRPQREAVSMRPLKRRNGVSERGPWSAPGDGRTSGHATDGRRGASGLPKPEARANRKAITPVAILHRRRLQAARARSGREGIWPELRPGIVYGSLSVLRTRFREVATCSGPVCSQHSCLRIAPSRHGLGA